MKKSMTYSLNRIQSTEPLRMQLSMDFVRLFKYLCCKIPDVEWSGILFYNIKNIKKPVDQWIIQPFDIMLLDIGTHSYTEYGANEEVVKYMMKNSIVLCRTTRMGHIHSHNSMRTFFSPTDMDELIENSEIHDVYFSMIVNNNIDICAKLLTKASVPRLKSKSGYRFNISDDVMIFYDVYHDFHASEVKTKVFDSAIKSINVENAKREKEKAEKEKAKKNNYKNYYDTESKEVKLLSKTTESDPFYSHQDVQDFLFNLISIEGYLFSGRMQAHDHSHGLQYFIDTIQLPINYAEDLLENFEDMYICFMGEPDNREEVESVINSCISMLSGCRDTNKNLSTIVHTLKECPNAMFGTPTLFTEKILFDGQI